jgi:predicted deacylase
LAARVAHHLRHTVLEEIDFGIDFHTGGANRYNFPQTRFAPNDDRAREISNAFNAPISIESKLIEKSIRKEAFKMGKSIVVYEGGESMRFDQSVIEQGVEGAKKVLNHYEMIEYSGKKIESIHTNGSMWIRAKNSGLIQMHVTSGDTVKRKDVIASIVDPFGNFKTKIKAPKDGIIIGHSNAPVINQGDALFHLGISND